MKSNICLKDMKRQLCFMVVAPEHLGRYSNAWLEEAVSYKRKLFPGENAFCSNSHSAEILSKARKSWIPRIYFLLFENCYCIASVIDVWERRMGHYQKHLWGIIQQH